MFPDPPDRWQLSVQSDSRWYNIWRPLGFFSRTAVFNCMTMGALSQSNDFWLAEIWCTYSVETYLALWKEVYLYDTISSFNSVALLGCFPYSWQAWKVAELILCLPPMPETFQWLQVWAADLFAQWCSVATRGQTPNIVHTMPCLLYKIILVPVSQCKLVGKLAAHS